MVMNNYQPVSMLSEVTKIKLFRFRDIGLVEREMNQWLSEKKVHVRHVTQSQSENQGWFEFVITVFYEDV